MRPNYNHFTKCLRRAFWTFASHFDQHGFIANMAASILHFTKRFTFHAQIFARIVNAFGVIQIWAAMWTVAEHVPATAWLLSATIRIKAGMAKWFRKAQQTGVRVNRFHVVGVCARQTAIDHAVREQWRGRVKANEFADSSADHVLAGCAQNTKKKTQWSQCDHS